MSADAPAAGADDASRPPEPRLRVALFGSPAFAVPLLDRLHAEHDVALVVTQPDRPAGRGLRLRAPAAAARARELGLEVAQPTRLRRDESFRERLAALDLDVAITAAYGRILPQALLDVPRHGFLNAHASLLPAYRGAAPIQWALIRGESETGVTVMQTEAGLDTGPIRHVRRTAIGADETAPDLFARLAALAADAMSEALALLARGDLPSRPQDDASATMAPLLTREDGRVRWADTARAGYDRWRGVAAWPRSWFVLPDPEAEDADGADRDGRAAEGAGASAHAPPAGGRTVRVDALRVDADAADVPPDTKPGTVLAVAEEGVSVACGEGALLLQRVTPSGKRTMPARDWAVGARVRKGDRLA